MDQKKQNRYLVHPKEVELMRVSIPLESGTRVKYMGEKYIVVRCDKVANTDMYQVIGRKILKRLEDK